MRVLERLLGGEASPPAIQQMSGDAFLALDRALAEEYAGWTRPPPPPAGTFRACVPYTPGYSDWEFRAALMFAHAVVIPDPIDGFFLDRGGFAVVAGYAMARRRAGGETNAEPARQELLGELFAGDNPEALKVARQQLQQAVEFLNAWRPALEAGFIDLVPLRTALNQAVRLISHEPTESLALPMVIGRATRGGLEGREQALQEFEEYRSEWPMANIRFTHAVQSTSQFVATNPFEWEYLCAALQGAAGGLQDRAMSDSRAIAALGSLISVDVPLLTVDAERAIRIREDADEFHAWQQSLSSTVRRIPIEASPGSPDFVGAATNVLRDELEPAARQLAKASWHRRVRDAAPKELVTLSLGAAGIAGLSQVATIGAAAFATPAIAVAARLAAVAIFPGASEGDSAVLAHLIRRS